ncbi:N-6 DNA methylase [Salmonella enterica subsp. enterica]|nr:N-6 DNA methylase [Salmonella enterica subsp. enterica]
MAIDTCRGVLFRGGAEERIRVKAARRRQYRYRHWPTRQPVFSTAGIPVCILNIEEVQKPDDVLFVNASECAEGGGRTV